MANKNTELKEKENKKLRDKISGLKIDNKNLRELNEQLEVMVKKLQAAEQEAEEYKVKKKTIDLHKPDVEVVETSKVKSLGIVRPFGTGRYGETFEAIFDNRKYAVKVLHKSLLDPSQSVRDVVTEMKKKCSQCFDIHHLNLSKLIYMSDFDSRPVFVTELMEMNLSTYIRQKRGNISLNLQVLLSLGMSHGLEALHKHSLIHGHLHDRNILIQGDQAKISDYYYPLLGLEDHLVEVKSTLPYIAPEVTEDRALLSSCSDIYSLGVLILQVVTGATPTEESTKDITGHVPQAHILSWLIQQCSIKDSSRRPSATMLCGEIWKLQESAQYISSRAIAQSVS